jgi:branched-chain amino acid transport system substrate-binding protein
MEQARRLVESDEVLLISVQSLGTPANNAIQKFMDQNKVPQLFVATGHHR